jgi:hypothetical protein
VSESQLVLDRSNIIMDGYSKLRTPPNLKIVRQLASCVIRETEVWSSDASISVQQLGEFPETAVGPTCRSVDSGGRARPFCACTVSGAQLIEWVLCNSGLGEEWDWNS